jgi:hypothetical protein
VHGIAELVVSLLDSQNYSPIKRHSRLKQAVASKKQPPTPNLKAIPVFRHLTDIHVSIVRLARQEGDLQQKAKQKPRTPSPTTPLLKSFSTQPGKRSSQIRSGQLPKPDKRGEMGKIGSTQAVRASKTPIFLFAHPV